jgi:hypothetical protein
MHPETDRFRLPRASALFALLTLGAAVAALAGEGGETHSLDDVDTGVTHSLDSADTGRTDALDRVDEGRTHALDAADDGSTHSLDSADTGRTDALDRVDVGRTHALDAVEAGDRRASRGGADPSAGPIADGDWEARATRARQRIAAAEQRLDQANAVYGNMMARSYPRGEAKQRIIDERDAAQSALDAARAELAAIEEGAAEAGDPL